MTKVDVFKIRMDELISMLFDYDYSIQDKLIDSLNGLEKMKIQLKEEIEDDYEEISKKIDELIRLSMLYMKEDTLNNYVSCVKTINSIIYMLSDCDLLDEESLGI